MFIVEDMESTDMARSTVMEAPKENTATAITANASMGMDLLVMDIVTKLVNPLNLVNPHSYLTLQMNLGTFWILNSTALTMICTIAKRTVEKLF